MIPSLMCWWWCSWCSIARLNTEDHFDRWTLGVSWYVPNSQIVHSIGWVDCLCDLFLLPCHVVSHTPSSERIYLHFWRADAAVQVFLGWRQFPLNCASHNCFNPFAAWPRSFLGRTVHTKCPGPEGFRAVDKRAFGFVVEGKWLLQAYTRQLDVPPLQRLPLWWPVCRGWPCWHKSCFFLLCVAFW